MYIIRQIIPNPWSIFGASLGPKCVLNLYFDSNVQPQSEHVRMTSTSFVHTLSGLQEKLIKYFR